MYASARFRTDSTPPARNREEVEARANVIIQKTGVRADIGVLVRLHCLPLTRQGVRNLDVLAPSKFRNGRRFRKPRNYEVVCPHPEEAIGEEIFSHLMTGIDTGHEYTYYINYRICEDCSGESPNM